MSKLIVQVKCIDKVIEHPNADRLQLAYVDGWQCVIKKGQFSAKDLVVFIPPDSCVPTNVAEANAFLQYLGTGNRVRSTRLRGEPSHGILIPCGSPAWVAGDDVVDYYGITKYVPPFNSTRRSGGDQEKAHPLFVKYTEIDNLRHFPSVFVDGEEVVVTEKIHGSNSRIGIIDKVMMAGSRNHRRKMPINEIRDNFFIEFLRTIKLWHRLRKTEPDVGRWTQDWYWMPWTVSPIRLMMEQLAIDSADVMAFGETFGLNVQKGVSYGSPDKLDWRCFDIRINGKYLDYDDQLEFCKKYGVQTVPEIYRGPYSLQKIKELSEGKTVVNGGNHIKEGVVVRPVKERYDPRIGRCVLKYVGDSYLLAKETGDFGDDEDEV